MDEMENQHPGPQLLVFPFLRASPAAGGISSKESKLRLRVSPCPRNLAGARSEPGCHTGHDSPDYALMLPVLKSGLRFML